MAHTLVSDLKAVDSIPDYLGFDKKQGYKKVLQEWNSLSPLVKNAVNGKLSIYEEFEKINQRVGGIKLWYPSAVSNEDLKEIREFRKILGDIPIYSKWNLSDPVSGAVSGAVGGGGIDALFNIKGLRRGKVTRREFLKESLEFAGLGALFLGGAFGYTNKSREDGLNTARENAKYVQDKIDEFRNF